MRNLIDNASRYSPAAAETAITALKSGTWYETTRKAARLTIQVAQSNTRAVSAIVSKSGKRAGKRARRFSHLEIVAVATH
ncbi:hypothetical protein [Paraburkholderia hospita]|uniref:Uncharacterized protein n=1 Tax=Paraburkholderia hospita TaxID=169430 RepID=A0AAN1JM05_9BURK|nr:hypothetical protein [Paraburkholderia hospita]AUT76559.1 hypothetical protein C2L64_51360 [Paraburkholderia hospita]AXF05942.1 hypothetical protein CUJ88_47110 [Paraburkholderia hospita]